MIFPFPCHFMQQAQFAEPGKISAYPRRCCGLRRPDMDFGQLTLEGAREHRVAQLREAEYHVLGEAARSSMKLRTSLLTSRLSAILR